MKGTFALGRRWTLSFSSWEECVYPPSPAISRQIKVGTPPGGGRGPVTVSVVAAIENTHVFLRSHFQPPGSGSG